MQAIRSEGNGNLDFQSLLRPQPTTLPANCSSEASAPSRSQSASSTIVSPDPSDAPCDSSAQSGPRLLKEENYIAIADISSLEPEHPAPLKPGIDEPDLRLGLGHYPSQEASDVASFHLFPQTPKMVSATPTSGRFRSLSADLQSMNSKRPFSDSIAQGLPTIRKAAFANSDDLKAGAAASIAYRDMKLALPKQQPRAMYWGIPIGSERSSEPSEKRKFSTNNESPISMTSYVEHATPSMVVVGCSVERDSDKASPAKEQATGWPPVRSYRRSAINAGRCRPVGTDSDTHGANYVKVNMDGIPVGRKVDLNAFNNYDDLLCSLEGMFGAGGCFLRAGDFVLTYEDKEGDWMLVGDVPWRMFVKVVKRLRITRASDATCDHPYLKAFLAVMEEGCRIDMRTVDERESLGCNIVLLGPERGGVFVHREYF